MPIRLAVCSNCILSICHFSFFPFGFESGIWYLIAPVPVPCLLVTFYKNGSILHRRVNIMSCTKLDDDI